MRVTTKFFSAVAGALLMSASVGAAKDLTVVAVEELSQAQLVAEIIVEANVSDKDVAVIAACVIQKADERVIASLISAASAGVEQAHVDAVVDIAFMPETMACVREDALI